MASLTSLPHIGLSAGQSSSHCKDTSTPVGHGVVSGFITAYIIVYMLWFHPGVWPTRSGSAVAKVAATVSQTFRPSANLWGFRSTKHTAPVASAGARACNGRGGGRGVLRSRGRAAGGVRD